jgi:hypothetical protein
VLHGGHEWSSVSSMKSNGEGLMDAVNLYYLRRRNGRGSKRLLGRGLGPAHGVARESGR